MAFDINKFRTHFSNYNEVSRSDKFNVYIPVPSEVDDGSGYGLEELSLQCEVSQLPDRTINMIEFRHYGFTKRIPHNNQYNQTTFTFLCTGDLMEKKLFDRWLDLLIPASSGLVNYPINEDGSLRYEVDVEVRQYDMQGKLIYSVNLIQAIPIHVDQMQLDWNNDQVHRLTVTFAYLKWLSSETTYGDNQSNDYSDVSTYTNNTPLGTDERRPEPAKKTPAITSLSDLKAGQAWNGNGGTVASEEDNNVIGNSNNESNG